jgi:hypothetical protein
MKNKLSTLILAFFVMLSTADSFSQKAEGQITMIVEKCKATDPDVNQMAQMIVGTEMIFTFKEEKQLLDLNVLGGLVSFKSLSNEKTSVNDLFIDYGGQKMTNSFPIAKPTEKEDWKVTYDKSSKKVILGYNCYKVDVSSTSNPDMKFSGFITDEIKTDVNPMKNFKDLKLNGFPLEYNIDSKDLSLVISASKFNKTVDIGAFDISKVGYKEVTKEELMQLIGPAASLFGL